MAAASVAIASLRANLGEGERDSDRANADPLVSQANGVHDAVQRCCQLVDFQEGRRQQHSDLDSSYFDSVLEQFIDHVKETVALAAGFVIASADFYAFTGSRVQQAQSVLQELTQFAPRYQVNGEIGSVERHQSEQVIRCGSLLSDLLHTLGIPQQAVGEALQSPVDTGDPGM